MPEISRFFGMVIAMYFADHNPPHFHVRYGSYKAVVGIDPVVLREGELPPRALALIVEWATIHQDQLRENWERARIRQSLTRIDPLQ